MIDCDKPECLNVIWVWVYLHFVGNQLQAAGEANHPL